jgi:hypothetical protein
MTEIEEEHVKDDVKPVDAKRERQALSTDRLGTASIVKLLLEFSIPAIIMMTFNALAALVIIGGAKKYVAPLYNRVQ